MRQKGIVGIFVLVLVLVIAVAGGAYYLGKVSINPQVNETNQATSTTPLPSKASETEGDPTADWKTYKDSFLGIEFKYPDTWYLERIPNWTFDVFLEKHPIVIPKFSEFKTSIQVGFNEAMDTKTNQKLFLEKTLTEGMERMKSSFDPSTVKLNELTVGDKKAVQISGSYGPGIGEGEYASLTLVQMDNELLEISSNKESENIYKQMLTTFKFTSQ